MADKIGLRLDFEGVKDPKPKPPGRLVGCCDEDCADHLTLHGWRPVYIERFHYLEPGEAEKNMRCAVCGTDDQEACSVLA
jgi:hypothetical protein